MLLWLGIIIFAFGAVKLFNDASIRKSNRADKLKDIECRLAQKKRREESGEVETPEEARTRRRNNRRR